MRSKMNCGNSVSRMTVALVLLTVGLIIVPDRRETGF
jgi:hypothetical protein